VVDTSAYPGPTTFAAHAERVREAHEPVEFAVPVEIDGEIRDSPMRGAVGKSEILEQVRAACETFN
jgi:hypothetical protein